MATSTIRIEADAVIAEIAPSRGGMLTRLAVGGDELLYLDKATLDDPEQKVRGGVPFLFPVAGRLPDDSYEVDGKRYSLPQHGFARDRVWTVVNANARDLELRLIADDATLAAFPFKFDVRLRYKASGNTLTIEQTYANMDSVPMPLAAGFHPYFLVPDADKRAAAVATGATRAWDNVAGREVDVDGIDLARPEVDLALLDHGARDVRLDRPGRRSVRMTWGDPFSTVVVWTLAGKDFVCVEPWTAPPGALAHGDVPHIGPRETRKVALTITGME